MNSTIIASNYETNLPEFDNNISVFQRNIKGTIHLRQWVQLFRIHSLTNLSNSSNIKVWLEQTKRLEAIKKYHEQYDDAETPKLSASVMTGARRLILLLTSSGEEPPTGITGTCDATITFEWHDWNGTKVFRSLDVLSENEVEEFIMEDANNTVLRTLTF